jgi:hypothetical protein
MSDRWREAHRYVEWMAATFEIEHGIDVHGNDGAMQRLKEIARLAREDGGPQELHVDALVEGKSLVVTLTGDELDDIFDGTTPKPDVEPSRQRRRAESKSEGGWDMRLVRVAIVTVLVCCAIIAFAAHQCGEEHHDHDVAPKEHERH